MKAGIVMDDYKRDRFAAALTDAGFSFRDYPGPTKGTHTFTVEYEAAEFKALGAVIKTANRQSKRGAK